MKLRPSMQRIDTVVFLLLSVFMMGAVLFGYRTFSINASYISYLACGEQCEVLRHISRQQQQAHLHRFGNKQAGDRLETGMGQALADTQEHYRLLLSLLVNRMSSDEPPTHYWQTFPSWVRSIYALAELQLSFFRTIPMNFLYLLSVFLGLTFHYFFTIFLVLLMITGSILLEKITINGHTFTHGRGLWLSLHMLPFLFAHGTVVLLIFGFILWLYLFYLPPEKQKSYTVLLYFPILFLCILSRANFVLLYVLLFCQLILRVKVSDYASQNMAIFVTLLFFLPCTISATLTDILNPTHSISRGQIAHGVLTTSVIPMIIKDDWGNLTRHQLLDFFVACQYITLLSFIPRLKQWLWLDFHFHAVCIMCILMSLFLTKHTGNFLMFLNSLILKTALEKWLIEKNRDTDIDVAEKAMS